MLHATLKSLLARKLRLALTALAVVLGVAFVSGTFILTDTLRSTFDDLFDSSQTAADLQVAGVISEDTVGPAATVSPAMVEELAGIEGVEAVSPVIEGFAQLLDAEGEPVGGEGPPTIGTVVPRDETLSDLSLAEGRWPENAGEIAVDLNTSDSAGFSVGDTVDYIANGPLAQAKIVGITTFGALDDAAVQLTFTTFDAQTALDVVSPDGNWSSVDIGLTDGVETTQVTDRIERAVGGDYDVLTAAEVAEQGQVDFDTILGFFTTGLLVFAGVSLFVGAFIIYNTFTIIVAQRTRELALLRAVGASRRQVLNSVLVEAGVVGLLGSIAGLVLGFGVAIGLRALLAGFDIDLPEGPLVFAARTVIVSFVIGVGVTVLSALGPALKSVRVPPVAALQAVAVPPPARLGRLRSVLGVVVLVGGLALLGFGLFGGAGIQATGAGAGLVILGAAMVSQWVTRPALAVLGWPVARLGIRGQLAQQNAQRSPRRTASTASALMIGLGLVAFVLIFGASIRASVTDAIEQAFLADFQLSSRNFGEIAPEVAERVRGLEEVDAAAALGAVEVKVADEDPTLAFGVDATALGQTFSLETTAGDLSAIDEGDIAVTDEVGERLDLAVGDTVPVTFADQVRELTVSALFIDDGGLGSEYLVNDAVADTANPAAGDLGVLISLADGVEPDAGRSALETALVEFPTVAVDDSQDIEDQVAQGVNQLLGLLSALLGLSIVIALFGIVNTLSLSVFERTREIGLLRAVGGSKAQTRAMIRWEAVLISILGAAFGIVVGVLFGWLAVRALADEGLGTFSVPVAQLALGVAAAAIAGVVAAILPARRAARTDILRALAVD